MYLKVKCTVLLIGFLIALLSRSCREVHASNEVGKLLKNNEPVMFQVTARCQTETTGKVLQPADEIRQYLAVASCQISNSLSEPYRVILHNDSDIMHKDSDIQLAGPTTDLQLRALVLLQSPNVVSYMILNPEKGHWLFTNELSGCDIFIATKSSQPNMPLIVHANADRLNKPAQQVENLRWKGDKVDEILRDFQMYYVLKVRIHITPEQPIPADYDQYWNEYKTAHQGVKVYSYNIESPVMQAIQFYGYYKKGWTFFLKGHVNGVITNISV